MGHIAHLRKQFKSAITYEYHKVDRKENKPIIYCMKIKWFSNWTNLISITQWCFCAKFGWNRHSGSGEKSLLYFVYIFLLLNKYPPWKKGGALLLNKLDSYHPRMLCAKFGWNWISGSGEEDFLISSVYFHNFIIISPWKRAGPFIWTNLNPLHLRMLCAKFG